MKKFLAVFLTAFFLLALSACDYNVKDGSSGSVPDTSESSPSGASGEQSGVSSPTPSEQGSSVSGTAVSKDRALEIALEKAGLNNTDIRDLDIELDRELGVAYWDVDFESGNMEYSYHIDASTEKVLKEEKEPD